MNKIKVDHAAKTATIPLSMVMEMNDTLLKAKFFLNRAGFESMDVHEPLEDAYEQIETVTSQLFAVTYAILDDAEDENA